MRSLYQSLEEVCVKDMLEGDNKYTCSQCGTKVSFSPSSLIHASFLNTISDKQ